MTTSPKYRFAWQKKNETLPCGRHCREKQSYLSLVLGHFKVHQTLTLQTSTFMEIEAHNEDCITFPSTILHLIFF